MQQYETLDEYGFQVGRYKTNFGICKIFVESSFSGTGFLVHLARGEEHLKGLMTFYQLIWPNGRNVPDISNVSFSIDCLPSKIFSLSSHIVTGGLKFRYSFGLFFAILNNEFILHLENNSVKFFQDGISSLNARILGYPRGETLQISVGPVERPSEEITIRHKISTERGSCGSPLINYSTDRVFAMHYGNSSFWDTNLAVSLEPLKEFIFNGRSLTDFEKHQLWTSNLSANHHAKVKNSGRIDRLSATSPANVQKPIDVMGFSKFIPFNYFR